MSENTPKLDLLMKDPVLDGHEYFNVKTMMNDNWEKIDTFAETVDGEVKELQQRLDTEQRKEITLQPGLQIIESDKSVPFRLTGLKGRTLVNLLGRRGSMDSLVGWSTTSGTSAVIDTTLKSQGTGSAKVTITGTNGTLYMPLNGIVDFTKHHLIVADLRKGDSTHVSMSFWNGTGNYGLKTVTASTFTPTFILIPPNQFNVSGTNNLQISVNGATGQYSYADAVRVYAISADEYVALGNMSAEQIAAKYPYVDSVKPVRNPYAIRYGKNLFPTFYERRDAALNGASLTVKGPYTVQMTTTATNQYVGAEGINIKPGTTITLSVGNKSSLTWGYINEYDTDKNMLKQNVLKTLPTTITLSESTVSLGVFFGNGESVGFISVTNPMLNIGSEVLPFAPREDSILALQTELYSDSLTGENAEWVFERDGQYFKTKMWERVVLNSEQPWEVAFTPSGFKGVRYQHNKNVVQRSSIGVKYDGKMLFEYGGEHSADKVTIDNISAFVWISNVDSGWGDSYTGLTSEEIKAYFMGWRMRDQVTTAPYTSGVKAWASLMSGGTDYYTNTLPTTVAPDFKTPYELVYQLTSSTIEPIVNEGQLTLNEGSNQLMVGTGIYLRELTVPYTDNGGWRNLGNPVASPISKPFRYPARKLLGIYRNDKADHKWLHTQTSMYGVIAQLPAVRVNADFDPLAAYSVTYLSMEDSPAVSIIGTIANNENSLLVDLVQDMRHTITRVNVVENKKAEKDEMAWLTPTLLGGWVGNFNFAYRLEGNRVCFRGVIVAGTASQGQVLFNLPPELRTKRSFSASFGQYNISAGTTSQATLDFLTDGRVSIVTAAATRIIFEGFSYSLD